MKIEILGTGCPKCENLYNNVIKALQELGKEAEIIKVKDMEKILEYETMTVPALVIDGSIKAAGKVSSIEEIKEIIK